MRKYLICLVCLSSLFACKRPVARKSALAFKIVNLGNFKITIPADWQYRKAQGEAEALILGKITSKNFDLNYSDNLIGEANTVLYAKTQLLNRQVNWMRECMYCLPGVTYQLLDSNDHSSAYVLKKRAINSEPVKVKPNPKTEVKLIKNTEPGAETEFVAKITSGKIKLSLPMDAPDKSPLYNIATDTINKYVRQIITTKKGPNGVTGVFFKKTEGYYIFSLTGDNLTAADQQTVLKVFKTIKPNL